MGGSAAARGLWEGAEVWTRLWESEGDLVKLCCCQGQEKNQSFLCFRSNQTEVPEDLGSTAEPPQTQLSPLGMLQVLNLTWCGWWWRRPRLPPPAPGPTPTA